MKLIIAEKGMLGRDIARAVCGKSVSETTPLPISGNGYTVVAAAGHILELVDPAKIDAKYEWGKEFDLALLPIFVPNWGKEPTSSKKKLVAQIKDLLKDADTVIHAGDPDDEGQLIVDEILEYLGYKGKVLRVLVNDNIEENIRKAFENLEDNKKYIGMGQAAYARSMADFCFGINESRLAAMRLRGSVSVGRVQTPTLGLIVRRDEAIKDHTVRNYYELTALTDIEGNSSVPFEFKPTESLLAGEKKLFDRMVLETVKEAVDGTTHVVTTKVSEKRKNPPLPFNLTVLQSEMNKKYGYAIQKTLEITQALRDKYKAITYNRSDCQYLKSEHHEDASAVLACAMSNLSENWNLDYSLTSLAFNDKNVTAHHGIIPQKSSFKLSALTEEERNVYRAIVERYAMQFLPPVIYDESMSIFSTDHGEFRYKSIQIKDAGFTAEFGSDDEEENKAKHKVWLTDGERDGSVTSCGITEKQTSPPKPYTQGTLLTDMASIAKYVTDPEIKETLKRKDDGKKGEHGGIGTVATRGMIIDKLKSRGFIEEKGKTIRSTDKGRVFYNLLPEEIKGADVTAKWWLMQEDIAEGNADVNAIQESVVEVFNAHKDTAYIGKSLGGQRKVVGKCPKCGQDVIELKNTYSCSSNQFEKQGEDWVQTGGCGLRIFKTMCGKKLPAAAIEQLLESGRTKSKVKGFKSKKSGKTFAAFVLFDSATGEMKFEF